ncbi:MAG: hypothetical protein J6T10_19250 [Methanobrevibacter sp.]|nr:hypothetical protein [Methanobrevibacter sp.]
MTFEQGIQIVKELGVTVAVLAYFIFRDYKFMSKLDSTLDVIKEFVKERGKE